MTTPPMTTGPTQQVLMEYLTCAGPLTVPDLTGLTGLSDDAVRSGLHRLAQDGAAADGDGGWTAVTPLDDVPLDVVLTALRREYVAEWAADDARKAHSLRVGVLLDWCAKMRKLPAAAEALGVSYQAVKERRTKWQQRRQAAS